jgi:hypothetical protein
MGRTQKLFEEERVPASALDAFGREVLGRSKTGGHCLRLCGGERREINCELNVVRRRRTPAGVEGIAADPGREHERGPAFSGCARKRRKQLEGRRVGPVDVLDDEEDGSMAGGSLDETSERAFLATRPRTRVSIVPP